MNKQITTKQDIKKKRAIELWNQTQGHVSDICRTIGVTRKTFYSWLNNDQEFAEALLDAEAELNDDLRNVLVKKAGEGSTQELIFYLKSRHPDFKQQSAVGAEFKDGEKSFKIIVTRGE